MSLQCNNNYGIKIKNDFVQNIKSFWNYINRLKKNKSNLPDCFVYNGTSSKCNDESAALFKDYFSSVYIKNNEDIVKR